MIRIIGALILLSAFCGLGLSKAAEAKNQLCVMLAVLTVLEVLKSEISSNRLPFDRILSILERGYTGKIKEFATRMKAKMKEIGEQSFSSIWTGTVKETFGALPDDLLAELIGLGTFMGRYEADVQLQRIEKCAAAFSSSIDEYKPKSAQNQKVYISMYSGIGLIIAVMLI